jgi:uncharacterized protein YabE (DUF348 family)
LDVDGVSRRVRTQRATVGEVLRDAGVVAGERDRAFPDLDAPVKAGMTISVQHARLVAIRVDGAARAVYTHSVSAAEVLQEAGVALGAGDGLLLDGQPSTDRDAAVLSRIEVQRAVPIHIIESSGDGQRQIEQVLRTRARTLEQALSQAAVTVYAGDEVYPSLDTPVSAGLVARIRRGVLVRVWVDEHMLRARTQRGTVGEVLSELGVSLLGADFCTPAPGVAVRDGLQIQVVRVTEETIIEQNEIPYETVWVPDPELELDQRRLDDAGANGMQRRRYKAVYHDGQENDRFLEAEWVAVPPRERQIIYGTRIVVRTVETPHGPIEYWRRIRVFRTAYTAATCGKAPDDPLYGITRLGWRMRHGIIAVDPRVFRLRSSLYVPDYGPGIAGDTGGLIKGRHIDLGYDVGSLAWHYEWGYVYVLTPVPPPSAISWILPDYPRER